jgi:hypothetical protein
MGVIGMNGIRIRSQNGESLGYTRKIGYAAHAPFGQPGNFVFDDDQTNATELGNYASKERALEVLDEIEKHIYNGVHEVYRMPKE